jgi:hypothetical protein
MNINGKAVLFGLNYKHCTSGHLDGCINDVTNISSFIKKQYNIPIDIYTDDVNLSDTSGMGIIRKLYELAIDSYKSNLEFIWIHYSGHGSYIKDRSGDEKDCFDECLVPSDYETNGLIADDYICSLFKHFNPKTRIICIFDCCHSGTIGDLRYSWEPPSRMVVENSKCTLSTKILTLSGCLDNQTSADAFNVMGDNKSAGALTACLLKVLETIPDTKLNVFLMLGALRKELKKQLFTQVPKLCTTYNIVWDKKFLP